MWAQNTAVPLSYARRRGYFFASPLSIKVIDKRRNLYMKKQGRKLLALLLAMALLLGLLPGAALAEEDPDGHIVMSFELYSPEDNMVVLLTGPQKVSFQSDDTGLSLAQDLLGAENVDVASGWITSFTIDGYEYTAAEMGDYGSWSIYKNNAEDGVTIDQYVPADGDVYRVILTSYDPTTYKFPVMPHDLDALYWAMAEYSGELSDEANALVQGEGVTQDQIDAMTAQLCPDSASYRVLIDNRTVQVDTSGYPYTYIPTLSADKSTAAAGETVAVTVTVPGGLALKEGSLKANGVPMEAAEEPGTFMFSMPSCHVVLTAEYEANDSGKLLSAVFSYDEAAEQVIPLSPAFGKNITEYALTVYDFDFEDSDAIYSTLTFDAAGGTTASWQYYMEYGGSGFYTPGPAAASGTAYAHSTVNTVFPGMTNGGKHRVDVTPAGGTANTYYFQMTMFPTLSALQIGGTSVEGFAPNTFDYQITVPNGTASIEITAVPFDSDSYYVYINGSEDDCAGTPVSVSLDPSGATAVSIVVDDGEGVSSTYTITIKEEYTASSDKEELLAELRPLMEGIASGYVSNSGEWVVMDMSAYADYAPDTAHKTSPAARQSYLNSAIEALSSSGCSDQTYAKAILALTSIGADPARLYPVNSNTSFSAVAGLNSVSHSTSVWSAPYTLAAYNQGDFQSERYETALVDALLDSQQADGSWKEFGTIDTTANAIAGLSFYAGDPAVDAAIQKAVNYLSGQQLEDGTFDEGDSGWPTVSNANSTAMVIVALAAVGINPADDARFVKNGYSVLDGLLSFALDDLSGFGRSDGSTLNASATEQGFRALVAAAQVISSGSAYQIYDFSAHELAPGRATGSGSPVTPSDPDTTSTITVTFSMKADTGYWISPKSVTVKEGSTVYHAFVEALKGTGITAVGAADGYVTSITNNGKTLGEFSNGKDSGWLYKVNGELPDISLTEYGISDGDVIVWYYTNDWTQDPSAGSFSGSSGSSSAESTTVIEPKSAVNGTSAKASVTEKEMTAAIEAVLEEESDSITIAPSGAEDAVQVSVTLPVSSVKQMADETSAALVLETKSGSVSLSHAALSSAAGQAKGDSLVITVERLTVKDAAHLADAVIPEQSVIAAVSVSSGGVKLTSFGGEKLTVSIPVGREPYENGKTYKVLVVGDDGAVESTSGKCVKSGGKLYVQVTATHLSTFIVTPQTIETPPFTDIEGHWAYDAITYVYQSGLMKGISADKFAPAGTVDRATLVTILYRLEGEPAVTSPVPFTDVTANAWYADAVVWASEAGIVNGVGEDRFAPSSNITREQLAAMLCRYASYQGYNISGTWDLSGYSDFDLISAWAAEAVGWANQQGLLTGKTTSILDPGGTASRAEAAAVLMRYIDYLAG